MKKTLAIIAAAVILLTAVLGAFYIHKEGMQEAEMGAVRFPGLHEGVLILGLVLICASEIILFSGIGLFLSKNRTPLKLILGIVIVIISLILLISFSKDFFRT